MPHPHTIAGRWTVGIFASIWLLIATAGLLVSQGCEGALAALDVAVTETVVMTINPNVVRRGETLLIQVEFPSLDASQGWYPAQVKLPPGGTLLEFYSGQCESAGLTTTSLTTQSAGVGGTQTPDTSSGTSDAVENSPNSDTTKSSYQLCLTVEIGPDVALDTNEITISLSNGTDVVVGKANFWVMEPL